MKRGGNIEHVPLDLESVEKDVQNSENGGVSAAAVYDRNWAYALLKKALDRLSMEYEVAGKSERFGVIRSFLPGTGEERDQAEAAQSLGTSLGTFKVEIHRVRKRFGNIEDNTIQLWSAKTGLPLTIPLEHNGKINQAS